VSERCADAGSQGTGRVAFVMIDPGRHRRPRVQQQDMHPAAARGCRSQQARYVVIGCVPVLGHPVQPHLIGSAPEDVIPLPACYVPAAGVWDDTLTSVQVPAQLDQFPAGTEQGIDDLYLLNGDQDLVGFRARQAGVVVQSTLAEFAQRQPCPHA
jgi:hypothetical protein